MENRNRGYSLIELLAAMTILLTIVMMMTMIFTDANRIWYVGTGRTVNCVSGRAALKLIAHDLESAVADDVLTFWVGSDRKGVTICGSACDEVCMVSLQNNSDDRNRNAREIFYFMTNSGKRPSSLMRGYYTSEITNSGTYTKHCYWNKDWYKDAAKGGAGRPDTKARPVAEGVTALRFFAPVDMGGGCSSSYSSTGRYTYSSAYTLSNSLPEYLDVFLEMMDELDAAKLEGMTDTEKRAFVERNARRYVTRVFFQNRQGYKVRF